MRWQRRRAAGGGLAAGGSLDHVLPIALTHPVAEVVLVLCLLPMLL